MILPEFHGGNCIKQKFDMIKARHNLFFVKFFRFYSKFMIKHHFRQVILKGTYKERNLPLLLIGNHFSWWDGFIANYLNNLIFHRRFHIMMLEEQLERRMFLNQAGAFSIKKNNRDIIASLNYSKTILTDPGNILVLYPQGEIQSIYHYPLHFEKGISAILDKIQQPVQVLFYAALIDYFSHRQPTLTLAFREFDMKQYASLDDLEIAYNQYLIEMINQQKEDKT